MAADDAPKSKNEPGEFTRFFQGAGQPAAPPPPQTRPEEPEPVAPPAAPGEFTRVFGPETTSSARRGSEVPPSGTVGSAPIPTPETGVRAEAPPPATPSSVIPRAGETTRAFTRVPQPQRPERGANPPVLPSKQDLGEFTRAFSPPAPPVQAARDASIPRKPDSSPSEPAAPPPDIRHSPSDFTKMFRSPFASTDAEVNWKEVDKQSAPPPPPQQAGEFTKFFSAEAQRSTHLPATGPAKRTSDDLFSPARSGREASTRGYEVDAFAAVVAGSLAAPPASAAASDPAIQSPPQTAAATTAKKAPSLTLLFIVIGLVLLLAAAAAYLLVFRS